MLGIIGNEWISFPIAEQIKEKKSLTVYIIDKESLEEGIEALQKKNCHTVIILQKENKKIMQKYPQIHFIFLKEQEATFDEEKLIHWIQTGKQQEIIQYLKEQKIFKNQTINLNHPILGWIKPIIEKLYSNPIQEAINLEEINENKSSKAGKIIVLK